MPAQRSLTNASLLSNIEVSFQHHVRKHPNNTLCAQLDWLRDNLEQLLQLPTASNFTFVPLKSSADAATTSSIEQSASSDLSAPLGGSEAGGEKRRFELR